MLSRLPTELLNVISQVFTSITITRHRVPNARVANLLIVSLDQRGPRRLCLTSKSFHDFATPVLHRALTISAGECFLARRRYNSGIPERGRGPGRHLYIATS